MLQLKDIHAGYGQKQILKGVSLEVVAGEIVAILGSNGAGKSTVLKTIVGDKHLKLLSGEVSFCGSNITSMSTDRRIRSGIGCVMQNAPLFGSLTPAEHLRLISSNKPSEINDAYNEPGPVVTAFANKPCGVLSGGERHRIAVELCLASHPKLILLDEPSAGVSPGIAQEIYETIRTRVAGTETAVLIVEQNLQFLHGFATRVVVMRNGEISNASLPLEYLEDSETMFHAFYGDFTSETTGGNHKTVDNNENSLNGC